MRSIQYLISALILTIQLHAQAPRLVVPIGHTSGVNAAAVSPDGTQILTGSRDGTAKLWSRSGLEIQTFKVGDTEVTAVAFSPDGQFIATGAQNQSVKLWDLYGKEIQSCEEAGAINSIAFSPDGEWLAAGTGDSTAGIWNGRTGKVVQTLTGHSSTVTSVAFSPDGRFVLTGSWDGRNVPNPDAASVMGAPKMIEQGQGTAKLWDRATGREIRTFQPHNDRVTSVAFSPDDGGKQILTGSLDGAAKLWDRDSGAEIRSFKGTGDFIVTVAFSPDGKLVLTGSEWGAIQIRDRNSGEMIHDFQTDRGLFSARFIPPGPGEPASGKYLLLAGGEARIVTLSGDAVQAFGSHSESISALAFSTVDAGKSLLVGTDIGHCKRWNLAGASMQTFAETPDYLGHLFQPVAGFFFTGNEANPGLITGRLNYWAARRDYATGNPVEVFEPQLANGVSLSMAISPPGPDDPSGGKYLAFGTENDDIEIWDRAKGTLLYKLEKPKESAPPSDQADQMQRELGPADFMALGGISAVDFSPNDGGKTLLSGDWHGNVLLWDLKTRTILKTLPGDGLRITDAVFSPDGQQILAGGWGKTANLWDRDGKLVHTLEGHTDQIWKVAFSPDGKLILTAGADKTLRTWDRQTGKLLHTSAEHEADAIAFSPDGQFFVSGGWDNKVKLWRTSTGEELATLVAIDSSDWVVTTPSGLFDASPGAMNLMHYVVGVEVVELEQLKERYYEPGLLQKIVNGESLRDVSALADVALYPAIEAVVQADQLNIRLTRRAGGMGKLSFFINGKEVVENINPDGNTALDLDLKAYDKYYLPGVNTLALRAYNSAGWLKSPAYEIGFTPAFSTGRGNDTNTNLQPLNSPRPELFAILVGTSDYSGDLLDLRFPDHDATQMAQAIGDAGKALFENRVHVRLLTTDAKTPAGISSRKNIADAFSAFAAQAKPTDILVVYFSGHGLTYGSAEKSQFYYLTKDIASADLKDDEVRNNYTVSSEDLTRWLTAIPAQKQVMILDACNSGKAVEALANIGARELNSSQIRALDRMKDRTGMFILTGAAGDKVSFEASQYGQGLLTYSLLQGMSGLALTADKRVDVMTLFQYARDEVPVLAKNIRQVQAPVLAFPAGGGSFDIGIVNDRVKIPLAQPKPVFIRNNFQDEDKFDDVIGLTDALADYFRTITARGTQAELIYVDVKEYENAYSIKGRYKVSGDEVAVQGRLFKGKDDLGEFRVSGKKTDMKGLVEAIVEKVSGKL
ncbi:MAG TPA: caspase family protein [Flavilitoribacter sp.]|nr:caspase family protein [Flavilitoribacter sp.]HMQ87203.1 caspase family protein [Flavilitoribacter sp.]